MVIKEKKSDKTKYEYQMKAGDFDEMMRRVLGAPVPSKKKRKGQPKK